MANRHKGVYILKNNIGQGNDQQVKLMTTGGKINKEGTEILEGSKNKKVGKIISIGKKNVLLGLSGRGKK